MSLEGKKILVGLTGGIACYKVPYLVRDLVRSGAEVRVVMTRSASQFITRLTMETVSGQPVACDLFPDQFAATHHIDLAQWGDLTMIAPATANLLGKVASGVADDLLTTVLCACKSPVMLAPAMNPCMWSNPITKRNVKTLRDLGYLFVGPEEGEMACEETGLGRMSEPNAIFEAIQAHFGSQKKKPKKSKKS
jgi:phosphopantothenoylcysteine decarboxylase/phosphopantothenate--cysteine ligase